MITVHPHARAARRWAAFYRSLGYQPLPSASDRKKPLIRFADAWERKLDGDPFEKFEDCTNIQVMTGRFWNLAVIDLDGEDAIARWGMLARGQRRNPRTWETASGGGGRHLWYSLPDGLPETRKRLLWGVWDEAENDGKGGWVRRKAIEFLCDRSLVVAPPSIHPKTGRVYRFLPGRSPREVARPAPIPGWVLDLPEVHAPRPEPEPVITPIRPPYRPAAGNVRKEDVLAAVHPKAAVARSWGLRFASQPLQSDGWVSVHDFNRKDEHASARFNVDDGRFWRPGEKIRSLFDLGVELGVFRTWLDCKHSLAVEFGLVRPL